MSSEAYNQQTAVASPAGTQVLTLPYDISEGQVPEGGLDFFFGADIVASLRSRLEESCGDGTTEDCIKNIAESLNQGRS